MPKHEIQYTRYVHGMLPGEIGRATFDTAFHCPWGIPLAVRRDYFGKGLDAGLHYNADFFVLYIVRSGRGVYLVDGHPYAVARGDVYILAPGLRHGFRNYHDVELDMLAFQTNLFTKRDLAALRSSAGFWKLFLPGKSRRRSRQEMFQPQRLHLSPKRYAQVGEMIAGIREDICEPTPLGAALARNRFYCLLGSLANWHAQSGEGIQDETDRPSVPIMHTASLGDVLQFCEENFDRPLSVPQLAARLYLSPDHFSRLFTSEVGVPPAAYLRQLRLEKVQTLLRDTSLNASEIAQRSGFAGREQMVRAFRAAFNTTPSEYRAKFRN